jgi:hypothetical protein
VDRRRTVPGAAHSKDFTGACTNRASDLLTPEDPYPVSKSLSVCLVFLGLLTLSCCLLTPTDMRSALCKSLDILS